MGECVAMNGTDADAECEVALAQSLSSLGYYWRSRTEASDQRSEEPGNVQLYLSFEARMLGGFLN